MNERRADFELLRDFVRTGNQTAFANLVRRHLDLVYATALRKADDACAAQEISQNVFGILARKAWRFAPDDSLPAWLHRTALLESKSWLRGELRRCRREQNAAELGTTMKTPDEQPALRALVPMLDDALLSLREKDRAALLLRFYESQSFRDVGTSLGVAEDAAQKRVTRALELLSKYFQRRGFKTASVAATAAALQHSTASASAATATAVAGAALQTAPPAMTGLAALLARLASLSQLQITAVCVTVVAIPVVWQVQERQGVVAGTKRIQEEISTAGTEYSELQIEVQRLRARSEQLAGSILQANEIAVTNALAAKKFDEWKEKIRAQLMAADYHWPHDSPFVRIPKAILPKLEVRQSVKQPGTIRQEARELLGLSPAERERVEATLQNHFAAMDSSMEANRYATNRAKLASLPKDALAGQVWGVPALGEEARQRSDELQASLKAILGDERWPMVARQLDDSSTDNLRRVLNLDAGERGQEFAVWVEERNGKLVAGYSFGNQRGSFSSSGLDLSLFLPGAEFPNGVSVESYWGIQPLSATLTGPALEWIRQQAESRLGRKGDQ